MKKIEWTNCKKKLGQLKPWEKNPRYSTPEQADKILKSFEKFNQVMTIAIGPDNEVYDGHQRLSALLARYGKDYVVDARQSNRALSEKERQALVIALSPLGAYGSFDAEKLQEWKDVDLGDWNVTTESIESLSVNINSLAGVFLEESKEKKEINLKDADVDSDLGKKYADKWKVKYGSIFQVGKHRIMCGDSLDKNDVHVLIDTAKIDIIFTDIPYGLDYQGGRTQIVKHKPYGKIIGDEEKDVSRFIPPLLSLDAKDVWVCCSPINLSPALRPFDEVGGVNAVVAWDKKSPGLGYMFIRRQLEFILFYTVRKKGKEESSEFDLWSISRDNKEEYVHGTQKPVALAARAISFSNECGKNVADLYCGSGSTVVASENLNKTCYAMDLDRNFVGVTIERMHLAFPKLQIKKLA